MDTGDPAELASTFMQGQGSSRGENARRVRLLLVLVAGTLLSFVAAWPSQSEAVETQPLYLVRELGAGEAGSGLNQFLAVGDAPRMVGHLSADGQHLADLEAVDAAGRVVVLLDNGKVAATERVLDPVVVRSWVQSSFASRARAVNAMVVGDVRDKVCWQAKQSAMKRLELPTHEGTRELTLAETLVEADGRIAAMHQPANQIPPRCVVAALPGHRDGYLHNLWHRVRGSS